MIPLRDSVKLRRFPLITISLIIANVAVFVYQAYFGPRGYEYYVFHLGLVPEKFSYSLEHLFPGPKLFISVGSIFSAMFMHGGWFHLLSNMWFMWIFADNIEDTIGRGRFLIFYFVTGVLAFLTHVAFHPHSTIPLVGASGAIAGVLGAYILLFPRQRILTLIPIFFFFTTVQVPAVFFLGVWFLMQIASTPAGGPVAWWAHIGGFVSGFILIRFFLPQSSRS